jgi:hypothetical protein
MSEASPLINIYIYIYIYILSSSRLQGVSSRRQVPNRQLESEKERQLQRQQTERQTDRPRQGLCLQGITSLQLSVEKGHVEIVRALLQCKVHIAEPQVRLPAARLPLHAQIRRRTPLTVDSRYSIQRRWAATRAWCSCSWRRGRTPRCKTAQGRRLCRWRSSWGSGKALRPFCCRRAGQPQRR